MSDLESALRTMLRERADDVTEVPNRLLADAAASPAEPTAGVAELAPHRRVRRPVVPLVAATAVAVLIAGVAYAVAGSGGHPKPKPVAHPTLPPVTRNSCDTTIPQRWQQAVGAATTHVSALPASVLAATPGGGAVVEYGRSSMGSNPPIWAGYVAPDTRTIKPLAAFALPSPKKGPYNSVASVLYADTSGNDVVLSWATGDRTSTVKVIEAIDVSTGDKIVVSRRSDYGPNRELTQGYVQDGVVYWQVSKLAKGTHKDTVWAYDLATRRRIEVGKPGLYDLKKSAAGVRWNLTNGPVDRPAVLPSAVAKQVNQQNDDEFVSDGRSYAWVTRRGDLGWWGPSANRVVYIRGLLSKPWRLSTPGVPIAVAGPLVQYQVPRSGEDRIIDVRTGATIAAPVSLYGSNGALIGDTLGPVAANSTTGGTLMRLQTTQLAELRCG